MTTLPDNYLAVRQHIADTSTDLSLNSLVTNVKAQWPLLTNEQVVNIVRSMDTVSGVLEPLATPLSNNQVTDIVINGFSQVCLDAGEGLQEIDSPWSSEEELRRFAQSLVDACDRRLDVLNPYVDLQLPNGIRAHIVIPPISHHGTHISLRIARHGVTQLDDLLAHQEPQVRQILRNIITQRLSFIVCGSTGSGKTTLLRALMNEVDANERIVVIEDVQELNIAHNHAISLQGRSANSENAGEVTMRHLVRQSLRMRPDRIVVGEIRGIEIVDLFTALNTGHQGSAATIHSNSAADVIARLHMLGLLAGMSTQAIHAQIASAIDVVIEVKRVNGKRVVSEIGLIRHSSLGTAEYVPAVICVPEVHWLAGAELFEAGRT